MHGNQYRYFAGFYRHVEHCGVELIDEFLCIESFEVGGDVLSVCGAEVKHVGEFHLHVAEVLLCSLDLLTDATSAD